MRKRASRRVPRAKWSRKKPRNGRRPNAKRKRRRRKRPMRNPPPPASKRPPTRRKRRRQRQNGIRSEYDRRGGFQERKMPKHSELIRASACESVERLKKGEIAPHDLLEALEARIGEVDGKVNALPTLCFERARAHADRLMKKAAADRGLLAGMPVAIKDLTDVAGVRTTQGSPIFADHVPEKSDIVVETLEGEGGIIYAKSNTPEFGAGANTFNEVFGATLNPWNTRRSAAGSSGGAAVALATGMAWLAHGHHVGGLLGDPASFCGIVGM